MAASLTLGGKPLQSARLRRRAADPRRPPLWLGLPALALLLPFLAAIACVLRFSLSQEQQFVSGWTLEHYAALADPFLLRSALLTLQLALASTVLCLVLAVPIALLMGSVDKPVWRRTLTCLVLLPMILNLLIQSYGWIMVLGPAGVVNSALLKAGVLAQPLQLLFNETGVLAGLVQTALPLAVFPILGATRAASGEMLEAAATLGASPWRAFFNVTLPQLKPGLIGAASIVFAFNASAFAVPLLLGGRRVQMLGVAIRDRVSPLFDWAGAAAAGVALLLLTLAALALATWLIHRRTAR